MSAVVRLATRGSPLARWQAERVGVLIKQKTSREVELVIVSTTGDQRAEVPLHTMGGIGVFAKEVEEAVLDGRADLAVHSAKDLPTRLIDGLVLAAIPERADPRDAMVGSTLAALPSGATVGTGSIRRQAQLLAARPDLDIRPLRGNIQTRLTKVGELDAIVVALAALERLDELDRVAEELDPDVMLPQVGQGALAVEARADDADMLELAAAIDDRAARRAVTAERAFLAELGTGCNLPCGALGVSGGGFVHVKALLATPDGTQVWRENTTGDDPADVGRMAGQRLLAARLAVTP